MGRHSASGGQLQWRRVALAAALLLGAFLLGSAAAQGATSSRRSLNSVADAGLELGIQELLAGEGKPTELPAAPRRSLQQRLTTPDATAGSTDSSSAGISSNVDRMDGGRRTLLGSDGGLLGRLWAWIKSLFSKPKAPQCPPPGFDSVEGFNLEQYISAPWFVLKQVPVVYQPVESLYCVRARYRPVNPANLQDGLVVQNYANRDRVNGMAMGTSGAGDNTLELLAVPAQPGSSEPTAASKLLVGPAALKRPLSGDAWRTAFGPYWVVAVGPSADEALGYDWAIVSGGPPKTVSGSACRTGTGTQVNSDGLGYDLSVLKTVQQEGCLYEGAE